MNGPLPCSILVATRNRARSLRALLRSLDQLDPPAVPFDITVVDNGSTDDTPAVLNRWREERPAQRRVATVPIPGKSRALNAVIPTSRGEWLLFLDDDVTVLPDYLNEMWAYCSSTDCAAVQGSVLLPGDALANPQIRSLITQYPSMLPRVEHPADAAITKLVSANIAMRRTIMLQVGLFDERLGPGASGFADDFELTDRIVAAGGRLGYAARAKVIHEVDASRLTRQAYLTRARKLGHGDYITKNFPGWSWVTPRLVVAGVRLLLTKLGGTSRQRVRALGRWHRYRGVLESIRLADAGFAPTGTRTSQTRPHCARPQ